MSLTANSTMLFSCEAQSQGAGTTTSLVIYCICNMDLESALNLPGGDATLCHIDSQICLLFQQTSRLCIETAQFVTGVMKGVRGLLGNKQ